jgi:RNA-binding proteins (RRM domain)
VTSAKIVKDKVSGRSKGFGFVEMPEDGEAQNALTSLYDSEILGRKIIVNEAQPKPQGGGGGGFKKDLSAAAVVAATRKAATIAAAVAVTTVTTKNEQSNPHTKSLSGGIFSLILRPNFLYHCATRTRARLTKAVRRILSCLQRFFHYNIW